MSKKRRARRKSGPRRARARRRNPAPAASNPPRRRRRRHNPPSIGRIVKGVPSFAMHTTMNAGVAVAGKIAARKVRGLFKSTDKNGVSQPLQPGSVVGSVVEFITAQVGGLLLSMVNPGLGAAFAVGGVMAPIETIVQQLGIKHISDSLGDDGYLVGPGTGVTLVSAYPDDYGGVVGEIGQDLGRYVGPGSSAINPLGGYVANDGIAA